MAEIWKAVNAMRESVVEIRTNQKNWQDQSIANKAAAIKDAEDIKESIENKHESTNKMLACLSEQMTAISRQVADKISQKTVLGALGALMVAAFSSFVLWFLTHFAK